MHCTVMTLTLTNTKMINKYLQIIIHNLNYHVYFANKMFLFQLW